MAPIGAARAARVSVLDAIPNSVVIQNYATTWTQGDGTWGDDATTDGAQDVTLTGDFQSSTLSDGSESIVGDGVNDYGEFTMPTSLSGSNLSTFALEVAAQTTTADSDFVCASYNNTFGQFLKLQFNTNENNSGEDGQIQFRLQDDLDNTLSFAPTTNPNINDGNRHDISVLVHDSSTNDVEMIIDGSSVPLSFGLQDGPSNFTTWDNTMAIWARNLEGTIDRETSAGFGAMRWHDQDIATQTISAYPE